MLDIICKFCFALWFIEKNLQEEQKLSVLKLKLTPRSPGLNERMQPGRLAAFRVAVGSSESEADTSALKSHNDICENRKIIACDSA